MEKELWIRRCVSAIIVVCFELVLIISAVDYAAYGNYDFYREEYEKYNVNSKESIIYMEMDELMEVTKKMMEYLRGDRDNLTIYAQINGKETEFFNSDEKHHMEEVRVLFIKGLEIRSLSVIIIILGVIILSILFSFKNTIKYIFSFFIKMKVALLCMAGITVAVAVINFRYAFEIFHKIFFNDDSWIFDARISRMINMLPEGFFADMAIRIGVTYIFYNLIIFVVAFFAKSGKINKIKAKKSIAN